MRKILSTFTLLVFTTILFAQNATITSSLNQELQMLNSTDYLKVNVVFVNQVDHLTLNQQFKENNVSLDERARVVMRKSMQTANQTQKSIINLLNNNLNKVNAYKSFWIINMMTIDAQKNIIQQIAALPEVDYIELYDHFTGKPIEIMEGKGMNGKSIGGIEPGLAAINAPAMWALGYTGKGKKLFSIDTGVWKDHPAISRNWLGNYQHINQAWHAVDSPAPVDKSGSHGTHTTGTVLGLESATNDTIGVAFNAYFMAADPIVTNLNDIKPLPEYIAVFEFALNPDGDTTTTDDMPDVINNSWGIDEHKDTSICAGYVTQMFNALEAAGIANVFSAGNEGPSDTTIGKPQYVSTGLVNTFTVGAIDPHTSGYPIATFSSRGPTACPASGSIAIKPEVVAPGVAIRSCVGQNNYLNYQGTSMAGPHASGAALLLKEAFPTVSGEEILLALYHSAIDLGVVGEDNTYGMGMIDVKAAYDSLALVYTPVVPGQIYYDVVVDEILNPNQDITCDQTFSPKIVIKNVGDSTINNATITYQLNYETPLQYNWVGSLASGDTASMNLPAITAGGFGNYELLVKASIDTNNIECDYINNQKVFRFNIRDTYSVLPYQENFEMMRIDSSEWYIRNHDNGVTWDTIPTGGLPSGTHSATMQLYSYSGSGQLDDLISTKITLPNDDSLYLRFDLAYQNLNAVVASDSLTIYISTDCGSSFSQIYKKGGPNLQTHDTVTAEFIPIYPHHWLTEYVDITSYAANDVIIRFESFNKSGNNLYLDNIWVYEGVEPLSIKETTLTDISVYPNPTNGNVTINLGENDLSNANIEITDVLGKTIYSEKVLKTNPLINLSNYSRGIYLLRFSNDSGSLVRKIIKE